MAFHFFFFYTPWVLLSGLAVFHLILKHSGSWLLLFFRSAVKPLGLGKDKQDCLY